MAEISKATVTIKPDLSEVAKAFRQIGEVMGEASRAYLTLAESLEATDGDENEAEVDHG